MTTETDPWAHAPNIDELSELLAALEAVFDPLVLEVGVDAGEAGTLVLAAAVPLEARHAAALARWFTRLAAARTEREDGIGDTIARRLRARGLIRLEP
jgi:hypothetical protein